MTIIKREQLGRPLTWAELDNNFKEVDNLVTQASVAVESATNQANAASQYATSASISSILASSSAVEATNQAKIAAQNAAEAGDAAQQAVQPVAQNLSTLTTQLKDPNGAINYPDYQIPRWRAQGDIRGWGAKCDGITDDSAAIALAVTATKGNLVIPGPTFIATGIYIRGYQNPTVDFIGNGSLTINDSFVFRAGTRGILIFHECTNPTVKNPVINGARLPNLNAPEPWNDGDAGVEFLVCSGVCATKGGRLKNFMTWGVIHTQCESYNVDGTYISDCMVQSGVGGITVGRLRINNVIINNVGLYGLELESRNSIETSMVSNSIITNSQKGVMCYDSILQPTVTGVTVKNCLEGISFTNTTGNTGEGGSVTACNGIDCRNFWVSNNISKVRWSGNTSRRFVSSVYTRTQARDYIIRVTAGTAYVTDHDDLPLNLNVGDLIKLDDGIERTVASVTSQSTDTSFGKIRGFTTTPAMTAGSAKSAIFRPIQTAQAGMVMIGGVANTVVGNIFGFSDVALLSFGNHDLLNWNNNTYENVTKLFSSGSNGAITNSKISVSQRDITGSSTVLDDNAKFVASYCESDEIWISNPAYNKTRTIAHRTGTISKIVCILDPSVTATGNIVLKVNGADVITSFTGTPRVGVANVNIPVSGSLALNLTDTSGNLSGEGFSIKTYGAYTA